MGKTIMVFLVACLMVSASQAQAPIRGILTAGATRVDPTAKVLGESDDHIDLDGQDLNDVKLSDDEWSRVENEHTRLFGQSDWSNELPENGPTVEAFAACFFGVWRHDTAGFSPAPLRSISDYSLQLHLGQDMVAALRLQVTERNLDGTPSMRVLQNQLQIARIYLKFNPDPAPGPSGQPSVEGMFHIDYLEDYDCPCEFAAESFKVIRAARVFDTPPVSRTYFFRAFLDVSDRLVCSDVLKGIASGTTYLRDDAGVHSGTAVEPSSWGAIKRIFGHF